MKLFDKTLTVLERSLDVRLVRQNVLAGNIANVDTPGFRPHDVDFQAAMKAVTQAKEAALTVGSSASAASAGSLGAAIVEMEGGSPGLDGNAVDLDRTMVAMAENAIQYGASARAAAKKLAILRYVASDGNG